MDTLNISHQTNGTFVETFTLDAWCDLYDFSAGHWHSMLRKEIASAIAHYEWSTENGRITYSETYAHGEILFTSNPEVGDTITIGATIVYFGATDGVMIGTDLDATMASLLEFLQASDDPELLACTYAIAFGFEGAELTVTYGTTGSLGNSFPIDSTVAGSTLSGETLTGGGGVLVMRAPVEDIESFDGVYYYDVRWQGDDGTMVPVVGGTITFSAGVTRDTQEIAS
jgi:hypothetical protein